MTDCVIAPAQARQTAQVLALLSEGLPALASPMDPPVRLFVAHAPGQPELLMGAAALWPVPQSGGVWGFRVHCQVLPACRLPDFKRSNIPAEAPANREIEIARIAGDVAQMRGAVMKRIAEDRPQELRLRMTGCIQLRKTFGNVFVLKDFNHAIVCFTLRDDIFFFF